MLAVAVAVAHLNLGLELLADQAAVGLVITEVVGVLTQVLQILVAVAVVAKVLVVQVVLVL